MEGSIEQNKLPVYISVSHIFTSLRVDFPAVTARYLAENRPEPGDVHNFPELLYIRQGHHRCLLDGVPYDLSAGQLIIYAPNVFHDGDGNSTAIGEIISFGTDSPEMELYYNRVITPNPEQKRMLLRIFSISQGLFSGVQSDSGPRWMVPSDRAGVRDLQKLKNLLELFLLDLYQSLPQTGSPPEPGINSHRYQQSEFDKLLRYLQTHLRETLTLEQISQECSMSVDTIKRLFRRHCGCGAIAYFNAMKIEAAKKMIEKSTLNFSQIAEQLGFQTARYFSRMFKEKTGMTPSEYAHSMKNRQ